MLVSRKLNVPETRSGPPSCLKYFTFSRLDGSSPLPSIHHHPEPSKLSSASAGAAPRAPASPLCTYLPSSTQARPLGGTMDYTYTDDASQNDVTITVLPASLSLVHIPRNRLTRFSHPIIDLLLRPNPTFLNVSCNDTEVSIIASESDLAPFVRIAQRDGRKASAAAAGDAESSKTARVPAPVEVSSSWTALQIDSHGDQLGESLASMCLVASPMCNGDPTLNWSCRIRCLRGIIMDPSLTLDLHHRRRVRTYPRNLCSTLWHIDPLPVVVHDRLHLCEFDCPHWLRKTTHSTPCSSNHSDSEFLRSNRSCFLKSFPSSRPTTSSVSLLFPATSFPHAARFHPPAQTRLH